ncbi:MAG: hypothetical protein ACFE9C_10580 [Candidatus Hodarchaeota archaeon]
MTRAGKFVWIILILKYKPIRYTRELLKFFCKLFENQYDREIQESYTKFEGDISVFRKDPYSKQSLDKELEDIFHLYLTTPFKFGSIRGKKLLPKIKKIYQLAKPIVHKRKGKILLDTLYKESSKSFELNNEEIADLIYKLVESEAVQSIPKEEFKS